MIRAFCPRSALAFVQKEGRDGCWRTTHVMRHGLVAQPRIPRTAAVPGTPPANRAARCGTGGTPVLENAAPNLPDAQDFPTYQIKEKFGTRTSAYLLPCRIGQRYHDDRGHSLTTRRITSMAWNEAWMPRERHGCGDSKCRLGFLEKMQMAWNGLSIFRT